MAQSLHESNCEVFEQCFVEGDDVAAIRTTGKGNLDVYLSFKNRRETENIIDYSMKVASVEVDCFPIGFLDIFVSQKKYCFTYLYKGENGLSETTPEVFTEFKPYTDQPDKGIKLLLQCFGLVRSLHQTLCEIIDFNREMEQFIHRVSCYYWFFKETFRIAREPKVKILTDALKNYAEMKSEFPPMICFSIEQFENFPGVLSVNGDKKYDLDSVEYFNALMDMDRECRDNFFREDPKILSYHLSELLKTFHELVKYLKMEIEHSNILLNGVFCNSSDSLISELIRAYVEIRQSDRDTAALPDFINYVSERYKNAVAYFEEKYEFSLGTDMNKLNFLLSAVKPEAADTGEEVKISQEDVLYEMLGSMDRILNYSGIEQEKKEFFKNFIEHFKDYRPKIDNIAAESRRKFSTVFFELYEEVILKYAKEKPNDKALDMFLTFGFVDSDLLSPRQTYELYTLLDKFSPANGNIYSMKHWLEKILSGEVSPSVNELGVTYDKYIKEQRQWNADKGSEPDTERDRLHFEVSNMFRTSHRVCSGHIGSYFPVLCRDSIPEDIRRVAVTPERLQKSLNELLERDFSVFHREVFYTGEKEIFKKEIIMKQVLPDIILVPIAGTRALMWQEISGVSKASRGRFIFPVLTSEDTTLMMIKLAGQFRWELCRSMMGGRWNDLSYNSLTSVYADYIDSYKKNKNLSPEAKESIRTQIKRHNNNLRNIFTSDYELWLRYEYFGSIKLNREVRAIMYQFSPFRISKRKQLINQPAFSDIATRFENERKKIVRDLENRYQHYIKTGYELEPELEDNLRFYKDM
ncbi:MAG: hypothetical protein GX494_07335 [Clostridiaceae bacterium]|nr:hypothetical protein [Clostridiaceae bacterium]